MHVCACVCVCVCVQDTNFFLHPRLRAMSESPRRPIIEEMSRKHPDNRLRKKLGMSLPNLAEESSLKVTFRQLSVQKCNLGSTLKIGVDFFKLHK